MSQPKDYDTTIARIAGNVAAGIIGSARNVVLDHQPLTDSSSVARASVVIARQIVAEVKATEPTKP